jgi:hypothetical protein
MVKISGNFGKVKSWINRLIRTKATANLFVGEDAGLVTTGNSNNFMGFQTGYRNTAGSNNDFIGYQAGYSNLTAHNNNFIGFQAGYSNTLGENACFIGTQAGYANTSGNNNTFIGFSSGKANTTGYANTFIGIASGFTNISGHDNTFIGNKSGYYETGNNKLFIDNATRANEADARVKALIYGIFDAATANQRLRINGILELTEIYNFANNAAAITGGLTVGQVYRNGDTLNIVH